MFTTGAPPAGSASAIGTARTPWACSSPSVGASRTIAVSVWCMVE